MPQPEEKFQLETSGGEYTGSSSSVYDAARLMKIINLYLKVNIF